MKCLLSHWSPVTRGAVPKTIRFDHGVICRTNIIVLYAFGLASEAVQPVNQMLCHVLYNTGNSVVQCIGAMGFVILNSKLPNQTDSYAVRLSYHLVLKRYSSSGSIWLFYMLCWWPLLKTSTGNLLGYSEFEFRGYVLFAFTICMF